jgi:hypothetical protein
MNLELVKRAEKVKHLRVGRKYTTLLLPDKRDSRWGLEYLPGKFLDDGGCIPISEKRAEKIIEKLERKSNPGVC